MPTQFENILLVLDLPPHRLSARFHSDSSHSRSTSRRKSNNHTCSTCFSRMTGRPLVLKNKIATRPSHGLTQKHCGIHSLSAFRSCFSAYRAGSAAAASPLGITSLCRRWLGGWAILRATKRPTKLSKRSQCCSCQPSSFSQRKHGTYPSILTKWKSSTLVSLTGSEADGDAGAECSHSRYSSITVSSSSRGASGGGVGSCPPLPLLPRELVIALCTSRRISIPRTISMRRRLLGNSDVFARCWSWSLSLSWWLWPASVRFREEAGEGAGYVCVSDFECLAP